MYYIRNASGSAEGPYQFEELKSLAVQEKVRPDTLVLPAGFKEWVLAKTIEGLFPESSATAGVSLPPFPDSPSSTSDNPISAEDAARVARQGAEAAKQGAQNAFAASVNATNISLGFWAKLVSLIKYVLSEKMMLSIITELSTYGTYAMALAAFGIIALSVIAAVRVSFVWLLGGLAVTFVLSLTQYFSGKFMNAGAALISGTPTRLGTEAVTEMIALIGFLISSATLLGGVVLGIQQGEIWPLALGVAVFLSGMLVVGISFNPSMLNIQTGQATSAGEEAIGIVSFSYKSWLRATPAVFGVLSVFGCLLVLWSVVKMLVSEPFSVIALATTGLSFVLAASLYPLVSYLLFLSTYLFIDVISAVLSLRSGGDSQTKRPSGT